MPRGASAAGLGPSAPALAWPAVNSCTSARIAARSVSGTTPSSAWRSTRRCSRWGSWSEKGSSRSWRVRSAAVRRSRKPRARAESATPVTKAPCVTGILPMGEGRREPRVGTQCQAPRREASWEVQASKSDPSGLTQSGADRKGPSSGGGG
eukprot:5513042-Prymnesium_polylepis.1